MAKRNRYSPFNKSNDPIDSGFSERLTGNARLIKPDGSFNVEKKGYLGYNLYELLFEVSWPKFLVGLLTFYLLINSFFALGFIALGMDAIDGVVPGTFFENFSQALFFSIQTFTTVGYGHSSPSGILSNFFSAFIAFCGLITFALATGLFFARFSKPRSHILFSKKALLAPDKDGFDSLQFRIVNEFQSQLINAEIQVTLSWVQEKNGISRRQFQRLNLETDKIFMFPLNWTIVHRVDKKSPLFRKSISDMKNNLMEILILVKAYNETHGDYIHAKKSYDFRDVVENQRFVTMYETTSEKTILYLGRMNKTKPV